MQCVLRNSIHLGQNGWQGLTKTVCFQPLSFLVACLKFCKPAGGHRSGHSVAIRPKQLLAVYMQYGLGSSPTYVSFLLILDTLLHHGQALEMFFLLLQLLYNHRLLQMTRRPSLLLIMLWLQFKEV